MLTVNELIQELLELPQNFKITVTVGGEVCEYPQTYVNEEYKTVDIGTTQKKRRVRNEN